jgi:hypothetical protein
MYMIGKTKGGVGSYKLEDFVNTSEDGRNILVGVNRNEKKELLDKMDSLDKKVETSLLSPQELDVKQCLNSRLSRLLREEKIKWYQRSKAKHLLEGGANTKYFHLLENYHHRKTRIFQLQDEDNIISRDDELKKHITTYYKGLFGIPEESSITLDSGCRDNIPQVTVEENHILVEEFTEDEVLEMKGFSSQWCKWIDTIIQGGHVGIKINDQVALTFQTKKGCDRRIRYHHCYLT